MTTEDIQRRFNKFIKSFDCNIRVYAIASQLSDDFVCFRYNPVMKYNKFDGSYFNRRNVIFLIGYHSTKNDIIKVRLNKELYVSQKVFGSDRNFSHFSICNIIPVNLIKKNLEISIIDMNPGDISFIMCMCSIEISSYLKENAFTCDLIVDRMMSHLVYANKDVNISETKDTKMLNIPCISSSEEYKEYLAKKTSDAIYFDLLQVTMHPDNLTNIISIADKVKYKIE